MHNLNLQRSATKWGTREAHRTSYRSISIHVRYSLPKMRCLIMDLMKDASDMNEPYVNNALMHDARVMAIG